MIALLRPNNRASLWGGLALTATNIPIVLKYAGVVGVVVYLAAIIAGMSLLQLGQRYLPVQRLATVALPIVMGIAQLLVLYTVAPLYDTRMDRDDALVLWWQRLLSGAYPYAGPTSNAHRITILPALHLVAWPFIAIGNVGYMVIAANLGLAFLLGRRYAARPHLQILTMVALACAPVINFEVAGRSDIVVNMLLFTLFVLGVERVVETSQLRALPWLGLFAGAVAATRIAIWPALVVPLFVLLGRLGWRKRALFAACALASFAILVVPFALWDWPTFFSYAPMAINIRKLGSNTWLSGLWLTITFGLTIGSTIYARRSGRLFLASVPVLACVVLATWSSFFYDVSYVELVFVPLLFSFSRKAIS